MPRASPGPGARRLGAASAGRRPRRDREGHQRHRTDRWFPSWTRPADYRQVTRRRAAQASTARRSRWPEVKRPGRCQAPRTSEGNGTRCANYTDVRPNPSLQVLTGTDPDPSGPTWSVGGVGAVADAHPAGANGLLDTARSYVHERGWALRVVDGKVPLGEEWQTGGLTLDELGHHLTGGRGAGRLNG